MSPPSLINDLIEQILLRLPPDDPACLVRASLISKPVRSLLAGAPFRRRYREFHGRPHLLGFFLEEDSTFVPTSVFRPAAPDLPWWWRVIDCRHGRALYVTTNPEIEDFVVCDPMTSKQRRVPQPEPYMCSDTAAVLCAVDGCHHSGCQEGPFRVALLSTEQANRVTVARLYSSETGAWSEPTSVHNPPNFVNIMSHTSVLVGEGLYFHNNVDNHIIEYKLGTPRRLSVFEGPGSNHGIYGVRGLIKLEDDDGGLAFASFHGKTLTLLSRETNGWAERRVIDLGTILPDDAFPRYKPSWFPPASFLGFAEGTDIIFVGTYVSVYMVELKSGRVRKVLDHCANVFPYMSFHIPAMEAASMAEGPTEGVSNV